MPAPLRTDSRYASARLKRLPDGTATLDLYSRRRVDPADFPEQTVCVTVQPGDTPFSIASQLYGSSRLYWVVCECIQQSDPFAALLPGQVLILLASDAVHTHVLQ